jgi:hypothetical protein
LEQKITERPFNRRRLPDKARKWPDAQHLVDDERRKYIVANHPDGRVLAALFNSLAMIDELVGSTIAYSVTAFREEYMLANPEVSVGSLDIDDELFWALISNGVYLIAELTEALSDAKFIEFAGVGCFFLPPFLLILQQG